MKKMISLILAMSLVLSMSITAFAAEDTGKKPGENTNIGVTAKYNTSSDTETTYSVDVEWTDMTFTYNEAGTKEWNAATHSYTTNSTGSWDKTTATVTVTNHSNAEVTVAMEYTAVEGTGVTGTLTNGSATLDAGVEGKYDEADSVTATLTISGTPANTVTSTGTQIGSIKVTIS